MIVGNVDKNKKPLNHRFRGFCLILLVFLAVREGFEPSVQFPVRQFSKLILSASQAPHQLIHYFPFLGSANIVISLSWQKNKSDF
jgi:hypothetical protein